MRIKLTARGGFAAGIARPERVVDSQTLDAEQAAKLARAVQAAIAGDKAKADRPVTPDAMHYTLTVDDGGNSTVLKASDADMSPEFAGLLDQVERLLGGKTR